MWVCGCGTGWGQRHNTTNSSACFWFTIRNVNSIKMASVMRFFACLIHWAWCACFHIMFVVCFDCGWMTSCLSWTLHNVVLEPNVFVWIQLICVTFSLQRIDVSDNIRHKKRNAYDKKSMAGCENWAFVTNSRASSNSYNKSNCEQMWMLLAPRYVASSWSGWVEPKCVMLLGVSILVKAQNVASTIIHRTCIILLCILLKYKCSRVLHKYVWWP